MRRMLAALMITGLVAGCAERIVTPVAGNAAVKTYPAHGKQVRVIRSPLPESARYEALAQVKAIEDGYGELATAERRLADEARKLGADAVINVKAWHAPRPTAWASPHAEGLAVKIIDPASVDLDAVTGNWY